MMMMTIIVIILILMIIDNVVSYKTIKSLSLLSSLSSSSSLFSSYNNQVLSVLTKQGLELKTASTENDMNQAAAFLASQMYEDMPNGQRRELQRLEYADLMNRYGGRTGKRKYPSALLLAIENEEIIGMVGIDCQLYDANEKKFTPMKFVTKVYDEESGKKVVQVLANLAIRRDKRKKGLGRLLVSASADTAKSFGYEELYLQVDSDNKAAQNLYRKEGFKQIFTDPDATCVVSGQWGLQTKECINLGYVKKVTSNGPSINIFNNIFNMFQSKT